MVYTLTRTQWEGAEQKEKFIVQFKKFVESDFKKSKFPLWFYKRLSMTFGHIAHYNQGGFYATFFEDTKGKLDFLKITQYPIYGDPAFTYSDAERVIQAWVKEKGIIDTYTKRLADEIEASEKAILATLKNKYEGAHI